MEAADAAAALSGLVSGPVQAIVALGGFRPVTRQRSNVNFSQ